MARYVDIECNSVTEVIGRKAFRNRSDIQDFLDNIPTADVVSVVRCKDCKHYTNIDTYRNPPRLDFHWCNKFGNITKENDYCNYGERRCSDG